MLHIFANIYQGFNHVLKLKFLLTKTMTVKFIFFHELFHPGVRY